MDTAVKVRVHAKDLDQLRGYEVYCLLQGHRPGVLSGTEAGGFVAKDLTERRKMVLEWARRFFGAQVERVSFAGDGRRGGVRSGRVWVKDGERARFVVTFQAEDRI